MMGYNPGTDIIRKLVALRAKAARRKECSWSPGQQRSGSRIIDRIGAVVMKDRGSEKTIGGRGRNVLTFLSLFPWSLARVSTWLKPTSSQRARETS